MNSVTAAPATHSPSAIARERPAVQQTLRALQQRRYAITPQMRDYDMLERKAWLPYLMTFHPPRLATQAFTTDALGFRRTMRGRHAVQWDSYQAAGARRGAVIGGSTAFGVGATSDAGTLASRLNERDGCLWWNFAGRGFNSTQELLVFLLHLPPSVERMVIFSGANNLVLSYLAGRTSPVYNSFYAQSVFERGLRSGLVTGVRGSLHLLAREVARKLAAPQRAQAPQDDQERYDHMIACLRRDVRLWALVRDALGCQVVFAFQPMAAWIDKALTAEEAELFDILDRCDPTGSWDGVAGYLSRERDRYRADVRRLCAEQRLPFLDLNDGAAFAAPRWLFVDRAHLTDEGYALAADAVMQAWP